jgi:hypothetical protein
MLNFITLFILAYAIVNIADGAALKMHCDFHSTKEGCYDDCPCFWNSETQKCYDDSVRNTFDLNHVVDNKMECELNSAQTSAMIWFVFTWILAALLVAAIAGVIALTCAYDSTVDNLEIKIKKLESLEKDFKNLKQNFEKLKSKKKNIKMNSIKSE